MRRCLTTFGLMLFTLAITAFPALAAETEGPRELTTVNLIVFALVVGSIVGTIIFLDSYRGSEGDHHGEVTGH